MVVEFRLIIIFYPLIREGRPLVISLESSHSNKDSKGLASNTKDERNQSRQEILSELEAIGVNTANLDSLSIQALNVLLTSLKGLVAANVQGRSRNENTEQNAPILSEVDKKILQNLLSSSGHISSLELSRDLGIPLSTIQRRRKKLEGDLIERNYSIKPERFGWRRITLLVSVNGNIPLVGKKILETSETIVSVTKILGGDGVNLMIDLIFKTNKDLLLLIDRIKSLDNVEVVAWRESVEPIGKNVTYHRKIFEP